MLGRKLYSGTFKSKVGEGGLVPVPYFCKSNIANCVPTRVIFYRVTGSGKGPTERSVANSLYETYPSGTGPLHER